MEGKDYKSLADIEVCIEGLVNEPGNTTLFLAIIITIACLACVAVALSWIVS